MGGRGASSGTYKLNKNKTTIELEYGDEYHSVLEYGRVKFLVKNDGHATSPMETMSGMDGRIYVTIDSNRMIPVSVAFYDENGFIYKEIDYKNHDGHGVHVHDIDYMGGSFKRHDARKPSGAERRIANTLEAVWNGRNP